MANWNLHKPQQESGAGDALAMALMQFSGTVLQHYFNNLVFARHAWVHPIVNGTTFQFPATARADSEDQVLGVERTGSNQPLTTERTIALDSVPLISDRTLSEVHDFIASWDVRNSYAIAHAQACAVTVDKRISAAIAIGAAISSAGSGADGFSGGVAVTADNAGEVTTSYPISLAGSRELQDDMGEIAQTFDENNVPRENRVAFLTPYLHRVLMQDKTLMSKDYTDRNDLLTRKMVEAEGFVIELSNNMVDADWSAYSQSQYQANFEKIRALFLGAPDAVGQVTAMGGITPFGPQYELTRHGYYMGAKIWQGAKWLRPEACGSLSIQ